MEHERPLKIAEGREAEIFAWGPDEVLRLYRNPLDRDKADREMLVLAAVRSALPCVPAPHRRVEWNGRPGILMERLAGRSLLAEMQRRPWRAWALAALTGRVHAELHELRAPAELPSLRSVLAARIDQEVDAPAELRRAALAELEGLADGDSVCHGDFHPDNVLLCSGTPVVIDWAYATRGAPCGDFARSELMIRMGALPPGTPGLIRWGRWLGGDLFRRAYRSAYETKHRYDEDTLRRWQLVRAVDRLADRIPEERPALLREADRIRLRLRAR